MHLSRLFRKLHRGVRALPNLVQGYTLYVDQRKFRLIDHAFDLLGPHVSSFADLGGVWRVHAAYSRYSLRKPGVKCGKLVDTDIPESVATMLRRYPGLQIIRGDFGRPETAAQVGTVDVVYFFDVLLHQANPDWSDILSLYAPMADAMVIFNQQYVLSEQSLRLTSLPLEQYISLTSDYRADFYAEVYRRKDEIHPHYGKPWRDIHSIAQWGITDRDLRSTMQNLGYEEFFFENHGRFLDLPAFENHAFIFKRHRPKRI